MFSEIAKSQLHRHQRSQGMWKMTITDCTFAQSGSWFLSRHVLLNGPKVQAPVVQTLDSAVQRINHYPADKY